MANDSLNQPATKGDLQVLKKELRQEIQTEIQSLSEELPSIVINAVKPLITEEFEKIRGG